VHFSLMYLCHRAPVLQHLGTVLPYRWFFNWTRFSTLAGFYFYPHRKRSVEPLLKAVGASSRRDIRELAKRYLVYRRWFNDLIYAWPNWAERCEEWTFIDGENHLAGALAAGQGAILLTGHQFGYERYVAATLAQKGYKVSRTGTGTDPEKRVARWGRGSFKTWHYLNYHGDYWHHIHVMRELRRLLKQNGVVLMAIRGFPAGSPDLEIDFFCGRFFLDPAIIRLIESAKAPVVPCFAICDDHGTVKIKLSPPLAPECGAIMKGFGQVYAGYLRGYPEFARIWKRVVDQESEW
jgi:lauroyl/myristoyl acyltransferase